MILTSNPEEDVRNMFETMLGEFAQLIPPEAIQYAVEDIEINADQQYNDADVRLACARTIINALQDADFSEC